MGHLRTSASVLCSPSIFQFNPIRNLISQLFSQKQRSTEVGVEKKTGQNELESGQDK